MRSSGWLFTPPEPCAHCGTPTRSREYTKDPVLEPAASLQPYCLACSMAGVPGYPAPRVRAYVAGSSIEPHISEAAAAIAALAADGWDVYDWPSMVRAGAVRPLKEISKDEADWITASDIFLFLAPPVVSGAFVEFGLALGGEYQECGGPITLVVRPERATIFGTLADMSFATTEEAIEWIKGR